MKSVDVFDCAVWLCLPCLMPCCGMYKAAMKISKWRRLKATIPKPLPRRRRALSVTKDDDITGKMGLIGRLPYELRHMVYVYAIGGRLLHIVHVPLQRRMGHTEGKHDVDEDHYYPYHPSDGKISLLQTCRQIYIEASHVLYATNTFSGLYDCSLIESFAYPDTKFYAFFFPTIHPERLKTISSMTIDCRAPWLTPSQYPYLSKQWRPLCKTVATRMQGLKHFEINLTDVFMEDFPWTMEAEWVKSLCLIHGLQNFRLQVDLDKKSEPTLEHHNQLEELKLRLKERLCSRP